MAPVRDSQVHKTNSALSTVRRGFPHCISAGHSGVYCITLGSSRHIDYSAAELGQQGKMVRRRKSDWLLEHVFLR